MNNEKQSASMPLVEAMLRYQYEDVYPLHTPGHKGGRGMERILRNQLGASVQMDVSLMSELDDIHEPTTYIKAAQDFAAKLYGSDACFWAVNGTSQAIHAMLMTALNPGDTCLVPRNAHRSVAGGLILGRIKAHYVQPQFDTAFGIMTQITPEQVEQAFQENSAIKAVLLTSPNYYGIAADVKTIAAICHAHGAVLLVDEAHGPHLGFSRDLPPSALQCGADASAQSTHKLLGAMTQCSMLHVQGRNLDLQRAADVMSILTTTSPNYLLMGSLDAARAQLAERGEAMSHEALCAAQKLRNVCAAFTGLHVMDVEDCHGLALDRTKVTVNFSAWGYTGIEVGDVLREAGIAVELVDAQNVLFLITYADDTPDFVFALEKIRKTLAELEQHKRSPLAAGAMYEIPKTEVVLPLHEVFYGQKQSLPLTEAEGEICGEQISFYPPGIPVLLPGERITREIIDYCTTMKALGLPVSGPADSKLQFVRVVQRK